MKMRETGMCHRGVFTVKLRTSLVQNGLFSPSWHCKDKERVSRGIDVESHMSSTCLNALKKRSSGNYSIETQQTSLGKMCTVSSLEHQFATLHLSHVPTTGLRARGGHFTSQNGAKSRNDCQWG